MRKKMPRIRRLCRKQNKRKHAFATQRTLFIFTEKKERIFAPSDKTWNSLQWMSIIWAQVFKWPELSRPNNSMRLFFDMKRKSLLVFITSWSDLCTLLPVIPFIHCVALTLSIFNILCGVFFFRLNSNAVVIKCVVVSFVKWTDAEISN